MRQVTISVLATVLLVIAAPGLRGQDRLSSARTLYAGAQYEDALKLLDELLGVPGETAETTLAVQQYRALCLLALGRKADAEQAIEAVLVVDPFYQPLEDEAAPWVRTAFREVRQRVLPSALQQLYGRAKQVFERKAWAEATKAFNDVVKLLDDPDLTLDKGAQADMRMVVRGFLDLSEAAAAIQAPSPSGAGPPGPATPAPAADKVPADGVYDGSWPDVVPPLPLRQNISVPNELRPTGSPREGVIEVIVSASGEVEAATIRQPISMVLDTYVRNAVTAWRYRPATKGGVPVRFRRFVKVVIPNR